MCGGGARENGPELAGRCGWMSAGNPSSEGCEAPAPLPRAVGAPLLEVLALGWMVGARSPYWGGAG